MLFLNGILGYSMHFRGHSPCMANFADGVNIRLIVSDGEGHAIGAPSGKFYDDVTQTAQIPSGVTQYRQPIVIDEEYGGDRIVVSALDADTHATLSTLKLNFENDL